MFFMRRVAFVVLVIKVRETLWVQLAVQNFLSLGLCIYLQWYKPFESKFNNSMETFNEVTAIVLTYFLFCFTDYVPEAVTRYDLGHYYNVVTFINIAVHVFFMLVKSFHRIKLSCKKCYNARIAKQKAKIGHAEVDKTDKNEPEESKTLNKSRDITRHLTTV